MGPRGVPLYQQVLETMRERLRRRYASSMLPTETVLVREFGVSRHTVRVALHHLVIDSRRTAAPASRALRTDPRVLAPACATPMSALGAQQEGFEAVALGAHTAIAEPLFTMAELVEATRRLTAVLDIPVVADGGAGFGEPLHTMRTVRELEPVDAAAAISKTRSFRSAPTTTATTASTSSRRRPWSRRSRTRCGPSATRIFS